MTDFDPVAFGQRLDAELGRSGMTLKALHLAARRFSERGTSWGSVYSYVKGNAGIEPRPETVEALARALNVLPSYLLYGGPRTEQEQRAQDAASAATVTSESDPLRDEIDALFDAAFPGAGRTERRAGDYMVLQGPGAAARAMLWRLWSAVRGAWMWEWEGDDRALAIAAAGRVIRAVLAPLEALDAVPPKRAGRGQHVHESRMASRAQMSGDRLDSYIIATCEALLAAPRRQDSEGANDRFRMEAADGE